MPAYNACLVLVATQLRPRAQLAHTYDLNAGGRAFMPLATDSLL